MTDDGGGDSGVVPDGSLDGTLPDGNLPDGSVDPCLGLPNLCTTGGTTCDADTLVTCAPDGNGCLVETRMDCTSMGGSCDPAGTPPSCTMDPCFGVPSGDLCSTAGMTCEGDSLVDCAPNAQGCNVRTVTDCAASPGGICDDTTTAMCLLPPDPCAAIPAADRCTTEGTSCDVNNLVTCAPDAFGCLVVTTTACDSRAGGTCDSTGTPQCTFTSDPCAGVTQCAAEGTSCNGPSLVTCAADGFGCLVENTTDCTATMFGFCDESASPARCDTAATDPCMGMTTCSTEGRTCDADTLRVCARNAFGCLVETPTDCTTTGEVCGDRGGMAVCDDVCSFRATCTSMSSCDGNDAVACSLDTEGCLVETSRTACTDAACLPSTSTCSTACTGASPVVIDCGSGTVTGDTTGGPTAITAYAPCTTSTSYAGPERVFFFVNDASRQAVRIVSTRDPASTSDYDLFVLDGGNGSGMCGAANSCLNASRGVTATETVNFIAEADGVYHVVYDIYSSTTATAPFTLDITCTPIVCGDGVIAGDERCDDGGSAAGDGCSATCQSEPGYVCTGTPSMCVPACGNGTVESSQGETCDDGGTAPGDGCSATCTVEPGYVCSGAPSMCVLACGNGAIDASLGETCDDGGTAPGDGCSATCTIEPGYACSGAPSVCSMIAPNGVCSGATAITATTTITGENIVLGGARPMGTNCGTSSGNNALYYAVTIPPMTAVAAVTGNSTLDRVLLVQDTCGAAACTFRTDTSPERAQLTNTTSSPITRIVAIHNYFSTGTGTYDISFTYTALAPNATCATARSITASTSITGENIALGGPRPQGTSCGTSNGDSALYYAVTIPDGVTVNVTTAGTFDRVLLVQDACGATSCSFRSDTSPESATLTNATGAPITRIVAIHNYSAGTTGTFDINFAYLMPAPNAVCSGATAITGSTTITGQNIATGGPRPADTGCGTSSGNSALYYSVDIPANTAVAVTTTSTLDRVLVVKDSCGATSCSLLTDSSPEGVLLANRTGAPLTQIVAVYNYSSTGSGAFDISFAYLSMAFVTETEPNDDGTVSTGASGIAGNDIDAAAVLAADASGAITGDTIVAAALTPAGDEDLFAIQNTGASAVTVTIQTGAPRGLTCTGDTGLRIIRSDLSVVTTDDDGGPGACSITTVSIPAGATYYAWVVEYGDNAAIPAYELWVDFN